LTGSGWDWRFSAQKLTNPNSIFSAGSLVGATYKRFDFTTYVFNLGWTDPTIVLALGFNF
jgi:hypothetical protein